MKVITRPYDPDSNDFKKLCQFIIQDNQVAEIERVCTHSTYRRKGLAKAVIQACIHRLRNHGIPTAFITGMSEGPINLYGKLEYAVEINRVYYELSK